MHFLLFIAALVFFAFMTPLKFAVAMFALVLVVTLLVRVAAR